MERSKLARKSTKKTTQTTLDGIFSKTGPAKDKKAHNGGPGTGSGWLSARSGGVTAQVRREDNESPEVIDLGLDSPGKTTDVEEAFGSETFIGFERDRQEEPPREDGDARTKEDESLFKAPVPPPVSATESRRESSSPVKGHRDFYTDLLATPKRDEGDIDKKEV